MYIEFLSEDCPGRQEAQNHIKRVYKRVYDADVDVFAPLLVATKRLDGTIVCAAGIRTHSDQFFSDIYLEESFPTVLRDKLGMELQPSDIMEVVSLASLTPFPVLPMMDAMIRWGEENQKKCGVFTATSQLRRLLTRAGLPYVELAPALASKVKQVDIWGKYYAADPRVCAFSETVTLSPRHSTIERRSGMV